MQCNCNDFGDYQNHNVTGSITVLESDLKPELMNYFWSAYSMALTIWNSVHFVTVCGGQRWVVCAREFVCYDAVMILIVFLPN